MEDGGRITSRATGNRSKFTGTHRAEKSDTHDVMHSGRTTTEILEKEMYGEHVTKNDDKMNNSLDKLSDDETDGPVLNGENKRLRIRKKILTQVREHDLPSHNKDNDNVKDRLNPQSGKDAVVKPSSEEKGTFRSLGNEDKEQEDEETEDMPQQLPKNFKKDFSLFRYLKMEMTRGHLFEEREGRYLEQREKVYTFMKTPRELEKLMWFGFLLCLDCFLFVFTYLPIRVLGAVLQLLAGIVSLKFLRTRQPILESHQICDLLRGLVLFVCCAAMENLDLSILYHIVRGQSVIKLYVIYNMLDIADRLFSSIGQDTLDALFWTAVEAPEKRSILMILLHFGLASLYVFLHAVLVLFQTITLNVAINSHNKVLMVVMVSNQFVELKGSVFKKFEKNNLFQMSCADIRERFYYIVLVSLVILRNMHELQWDIDHFYELLMSATLLLSSEVFVDWVKHAFITKFNCISSEVYREYRELLAVDATTSRLIGQSAISEHFDLVSRRLGFIPLPLGCLVYRVTSQSIKLSGKFGVVSLILLYLWLTSLKVLNSIILLGLSSNYVLNMTSSNDAEKQSEPTCASPDVLFPTSDPLNRGAKKKGNACKTRQVKALNEIDRYTLCSNRIV
ncbi:transmembrane anterior posterior transformation protein 1 homolog [Xenia sp. Carnegie-2017]|uniref:transmembrane anterior posterior transformation protein 1 homolog n=1 Tax=Xenia sp. Carnegie-2017 TaxID=2897299 RepID=UPI001F0354D5|nr:transmembrane anterior posterior transformation protein 1 homolog [Xenia sp. Carnegie-2017]